MLGPHAWTILWPGLSRLWLRGDWAGLGIACLFTAMFNGLLVTTFLWPRLVGSNDVAVVFNIVGWFVVLCFWGASTWTAWHLLPRLQPQADTRGDDALFLRAQTEYLRGHWYEAERLLEQLLRDSPRDADAQLLLAGLYRHTLRFDDARRVLTLLELSAGGGKWLFEIAEERRQLSLLEEQQDTSSTTTGTANTPDEVGESLPLGAASKAHAA
jgi:hypothetical protein